MRHVNYQSLGFGIAASSSVDLPCTIRTGTNVNRAASEAHRAQMNATVQAGRRIMSRAAPSDVVTIAGSSPIHRGCDLMSTPLRFETM